jgi:hypothetical protein
MWSELMLILRSFSSAVLSARDADGYPASVRTAVSPDASRQVVAVRVPAYVELQPGPASLLLHSHNEQLWDFRSHTMRGALERDGDGWIFRPAPTALRADSGGLAVVRELLACRRAAKSYLRKRGLTRPTVPWGKLRALTAEQTRRGA